MLAGPDALKKCGLEIISHIGGLINSVVEMDEKDSADNSKDSIDSASESIVFVKEFCTSIKELCIQQYPKLVLRSFDCISRGECTPFL